MSLDSASSDTLSIGGSELLAQLGGEFRSERPTLLEKWREALREEKLTNAPTQLHEQPDLESLFDRYVEALEAGTAAELESYGRKLAVDHPPFPDGGVGYLGELLSLRDVLARSLSSRLQHSPARLVAALETFEPAANRISEAVALGIVEEHARVIRAQQEAIRELSTPVLQVRAGLLIHPIIGTVDIHRARHLTADLLLSVRSRRGRVVVMDLTGVPSLDVPVATQLVRAVEAVRLLGATLIVSGISPEAARALASTGLDLSALRAVGDLEDGILEAEAHLGLHVGSCDACSPVPVGDGR